MGKKLILCLFVLLAQCSRVSCFRFLGATPQTDWFRSVKDATVTESEGPRCTHTATLHQKVNYRQYQVFFPHKKLSLRFFFSLTVSYFLCFTLSVSLTLWLTRTGSLSHSLLLTSCHTHSLTNSLLLSTSQSLTLSHSLSASLSFSLSHCLSFSLCVTLSHSLRSVEIRVSHIFTSPKSCIVTSKQSRCVLSALETTKLLHLTVHSSLWLLKPPVTHLNLD